MAGLKEIEVIKNWTQTRNLSDWITFYNETTHEKIDLYEYRGLWDFNVSSNNMYPIVNNQNGLKKALALKLAIAYMKKH